MGFVEFEGLSFRFQKPIIPLSRDQSEVQFAMQRRLFVLGLTSAVVLPRSAAEASAARPLLPITVVYVGARDCPYCYSWEWDDYRRWKGSRSASLVQFREVKVGSFNDIGEASAWPSDLGWLRGQVDLDAGTPLFVVLRGRQIAIKTVGIEGWRQDVLPALERAATRL
jgi:hypothetical protein